MKKVKIISSIIIIILVIFVSIKFINNLSSKNNIKNNNKKSKSYSEEKHPYGNAIEGSLIWENKDNFLKQKKNMGGEVRMAAFKTILPDPLPGEEENVAHAATILSGTIIKPGETFSLNKTIGPFTEKRGYKKGPTYRGSKIVKSTGGGVCKIATTLYNIAILAHMKIVERHAHSMTVPYVPAGQDATISYAGKKDFKFENTSENPILIWADTQRNILYMALYGKNKPPIVSWGHKIIKKVNFETVYHNNPELKPGQNKVVVHGAEGLTVKSWIKIKYNNGHVEKRNLGIDKYLPMNRIIENNPA